MVDPVQVSLCQKWTRSSFCSAKSGPGLVFTSPMVDPVQVSLSQKWNCLVFVQPKVDLVRVEFCGTKVGSTYRSLFQIMILSYVFIVLLQHDKLVAAIYLSVLFEPYHPRYMPLSVYSHWHTQWLFAYRCRLLYACCGNGALVSTLMLQGFLMVLIKTLTRSNMDKSGAGPVFSQPKVGPVQFSLSQKWTRFESSFLKQKSAQ